MLGPEILESVAARAPITARLRSCGDQGRKRFPTGSRDRTDHLLADSDPNLTVSGAPVVDTFPTFTVLIWTRTTPIETYDTEKGIDDIQSQQPF